MLGFVAQSAPDRGLEATMAGPGMINPAGDLCGLSLEGRFRHPGSIGRIVMILPPIRRESYMRCKAGDDDVERLPDCGPLVSPYVCVCCWRGGARSMKDQSGGEGHALHGA